MPSYGKATIFSISASASGSNGGSFSSTATIPASVDPTLTSVIPTSFTFSGMYNQAIQSLLISITGANTVSISGSLTWTGGYGTVVITCVCNASQFPSAFEPSTSSGRTS